MLSRFVRHTTDTVPLVTRLSLRATMSSTARSPVNLISVNTFPERAGKVIGAVIDTVRDKYTIVHAGNSTSECVSCVVVDVWYAYLSVDCKFLLE